MREINFIDEGDIARWLEVVSETSDEIEQRISCGEFWNGGTFNSHIGNSLIRTYYSYVAEDDAEFIEWSKISIERYLWMFGKIKDFSFALKCLFPFSEEIACLAIISRYDDCEKVLNATAFVAEAYDNESSEFYFLNIVRNISSMDVQTAKVFLDGFEKGKFYSMASWLLVAIRALIVDREDDFISAIGSAIKRFNRSIKTDCEVGTPMAAIFLQAAALIRLFEKVNSRQLNRAGMDVRLVPDIP